MRYYVLTIRGGIESELSVGHYDERQRNRQARKIHKETKDTDAVLWLNIDEDGIPEVGSWTREFFESRFKLFRIKHKGKEYQIRATNKKSAETLFASELYHADGAPTRCECDNTNKANDTVCRWCLLHGRRKWNDPEVIK